MNERDMRSLQAAIVIFSGISCDMTDTITLMHADNIYWNTSCLCSPLRDAK